MGFIFRFRRGGRGGFPGFKAAAAVLCVAGIVSVSCILEPEDPGRPSPPKIPHPLWVLSDDLWYEYNQSGEEVYWKHNSRSFNRAVINPSTGDIWAYSLGGFFSIYDPTGELKRTVYLVGPTCGPAFDTKEGIVWIFQCADLEVYYLKALNYKGEFLETYDINEWLSAIDVYEAEGEVWGTTSSGICKYRRWGGLVLQKALFELGYEYKVDNLRIDQTDGGVWLVGRGAPYFLKVDRSGKPVRTIDVTGEILDVGRKSGYVLATVEAEPDVWYLELFDKSGGLLWRRGKSETPYDDGVIADFDGSCWYTRVVSDGPDELLLGKYNEKGEHVVEDVTVREGRTDSSLAMWNDPYPYQ
jgi:hypothetical protein